jgi:hypothetical protein
MPQVTESVSGQLTRYTVRVELLDPEADPSLRKEGYGSETVLYVVFAGGQVYADHDRHQLIRDMPAHNDWLHEPLKRLKSEVLE